MPFAITDYITFGSNGRAACPVCIASGKKETNTNLSLLESGAYKCHRGCTTQEIRSGGLSERSHIYPAGGPSRKASWQSDSDPGQGARGHGTPAQSIDPRSRVAGPAGKHSRNDPAFPPGGSSLQGHPHHLGRGDQYPHPRQF